MIGLTRKVLIADAVAPIAIAVVGAASPSLMSAGLIGERLMFGRQATAVTSILYRVATLLAVLVGWVIFRAETLGDAWNMLHGVTGFNGVRVPSKARIIHGPLPDLWRDHGGTTDRGARRFALVHSHCSVGAGPRGRRRILCGKPAGITTTDDLSFTV